MSLYDQNFNEKDFATVQEVFEKHRLKPNRLHTHVFYIETEVDLNAYNMGSKIIMFRYYGVSSIFAESSKQKASYVIFHIDFAMQVFEQLVNDMVEGSRFEKNQNNNQFIVIMNKFCVSFGGIISAAIDGKALISVDAICNRIRNIILAMKICTFDVFCDYMSSAYGVKFVDEPIVQVFRPIPDKIIGGKISASEFYLLTIATGIAQRQKCIVCGKKSGLLTCGCCNVAKYCSRDCQKKDWKKHKVCGGKDFMLRIIDEIAQKSIQMLNIEVKNSPVVHV